MPFQGAHQITRGNVPDLERLVITPAEHAGAVRREAAGGHKFGVPVQGALFSTCQEGRSLVSDSITQSGILDTVKGPREQRLGSGYARPNNQAPPQSASQARTRRGVPDLERSINPAEHAGAVRREAAGGHRIGVPAQGALFHTCQGGRSSVSDSSMQLRYTRYRHGTTNTPSGTTPRSTQEIKRNLKAPPRRAPVAASQILSVLSPLPLSTLPPSGEKQQEVT